MYFINKGPEILDRRSFEGAEGKAYIKYETTRHHETPRCTDYRRGEERAMVLKNTDTGRLERLTYRMIGAVPFANRDGYQWYWGEVAASGPHAYLVFSFQSDDGALKDVSLTFASKSLGEEAYKKINHGIKYAAEVTTRF